MRYLGLDLAWGGRTGSGVCVLDADGRLMDEVWLPASELPDWIRERRGERSLLAIDAPLVVPQDGRVMRPTERELHKRYGRLHAGPFPGGAGSLVMRGRGDRGSPADELLAAIDSGTVVDPHAAGATHRAIEVFPAPTWIEVFGLSERIIYKSVRGDARRAALERLIGLLDTLADPPLVADPRHDLRALLAAATTAAQVKAVEDRIDARLCAWVGLSFDRAGRPPPWVVTGPEGWQAGYVVVPQPLALAVRGPQPEMSR